mmetsp:Transcript_14273/g.7041  ORF Transcript_14273/g.7041 Transcript_14273/m.7041 type:complete len:308 (+) Transcript_14273:2292-3215(+)
MLFVKEKYLPKSVIITEVGPRDGFQFEKKLIPINLKLKIIKGLIDAGIKHIQVVSFVNPNRIPQMADAEELIKRIPKKNDVTYSALVLNFKGVKRAFEAGIENVEISMSASNTHSLKNTGMSLDDALDEMLKMIGFAKKQGLQVCANLQCSFGCIYEGEISSAHIINTAKVFLDEGVDMISLSDTTGMAVPAKIKKIISNLITIADPIPIRLHLHDTRGLGLVNLLTALYCRVGYFDTAFGGMGGCPFVKGAAGNIATEDTMYFLKSMGIETGIDIDKVAKNSILMEKFIGRPFDGKIYKIQNPKLY